MFQSIHKSEVNTTHVTVSDQYEEPKAKFKWESFVPKSPKPIIPPKSTARVGRNFELFFKTFEGHRKYYGKMGHVTTDRDS